MKKWMIPAGILLLVVVAGVSGLIGAQLARRQVLRVPRIRSGLTRSFTFGPRMGGQWMPFNHHWGSDPMYPPMLESLAQELDLSIEELFDRMQAGESLKDITEDEGLNLEELEALMLDVHEGDHEDCPMMEGWGVPMFKHMQGFEHHFRPPMWGGRCPWGHGSGFHFEGDHDEQP